MVENRLGQLNVAVAREWQGVEDGIAEEKSKERGEKVEAIRASDLDLASWSMRFHQAPLNSRQEVHRAHGGLMIIADRSTAYGEYSYAGSVSARAYLRALEGKRIDFGDYVHQTLQVYPTLIDPQVIMGQYQKTNAIFLELEPKGLNPVGWPAFYERNKILKDDRRAAFESAIKRYVPFVQDALGFNTEPDYIMRTEDLKIPAIVSVFTEAGQLIVRINTDELNGPRWFKGVEEYLVVHEIGGHGIQNSKWKENIMSGRINEGYGITRQPDPEQWSEGMMDNLPFLVPGLYNMMSLEGKFAVEFTRLKNLVYNNVHILLNRPNPDIDVLCRYVQSFLPNEPESRILTVFKLLQDHPKFRANSHAYANGGIYFYNLANRLPDRKKVIFLKKLYEKPMTPGQIKVEAKQLLAA